MYRVFWFERGRPVLERLRRLVPIPMFLGQQSTFDGVSRTRENFSDYLVQFRRFREGVRRVVQNLRNGSSVVRHDLPSVVESKSDWKQQAISAAVSLHHSFSNKRGGPASQRSHPKPSPTLQLYEDW